MKDKATINIPVANADERTKKSELDENPFKIRLHNITTTITNIGIDAYNIFFIFYFFFNTVNL